MNKGTPSGAERNNHSVYAIHEGSNTIQRSDRDTPQVIRSLLLFINQESKIFDNNHYIDLPDLSEKTGITR
jgi:hypothetical protein